jgi:hypothetical protein
MNNSQRIRLDSGVTDTDKHIFFKLEQETDTLELLSLKLDTKEAYGSFNADYGVLVGRVIANNGIGIPNTKVSIFIPLDENDENDSDIVSIYPYKSPRDKNENVKRYNLLPRVAKRNPNTGVYKPKQPFGSLPVKEEFLTNPTYLEVYKKYYKYTTITNEFGDYMIFGVPVGNQTVHMSVDITDIGKYSMTPASMITNLGYSPNLFTDNGTRIKENDDLDDLPHIETQEISVDVIPFWGDIENFEIGITRQDFRIRAELKQTFILFGSTFTDGDRAMWGGDSSGAQPRTLYLIREDTVSNMSIKTKRIGKVTEKIYYYPNSVSDSKIDSGNADPVNDMLVLDPSEYSTYKRDGDFVYIISCNRKKVITDTDPNSKTGVKIVSDDYPGGVFTEFKGFVTLEYTVDDIPMDFSNSIHDGISINPIRYKIKIPQRADKGRTFNGDNYWDADDDWRKQYFTFSGSNYYSVAKFHGCVYNSQTGEKERWGYSDGYFVGDQINEITNNGVLFSRGFQTGLILTEDDNLSADTDNKFYDFPSNIHVREGTQPGRYFGANWLNFSIHLPQVGHASGSNDFNTKLFGIRSNTNFTIRTFDDLLYKRNDQDIAAGVKNIQWFARSDLHFTDFINVPITDLDKIYTSDEGKGFTNHDIFPRLEGKYRNGKSDVPENGGKFNGDPSNGKDTRSFFYRGFDAADCIEFIKSLGLF